MEDIRSLSGICIETLFEAWSDAFSDYESQWDQAGLERMLRRRGYIPELSFGAFEGDRLVGFTLNCTGIFNKRKTAYDTGTGITKAAKGKGLATKIFLRALPHLKTAGISQYLLEVLQHNEHAVTVYRNIGFEPVREFNYYIQPVKEMRLNARSAPKRYNIRETGLHRQAEMTTMWEFDPSWQNNFQAIARQPEDFKVIGAFDGDMLAGYGIIEPATGDIPQLAVSPFYRRQGIGSGILKELLKYNNALVVKVINVEHNCASFTSFAENNGMARKGMQYEMTAHIN